MERTRLPDRAPLSLTVLLAALILLPLARIGFMVDDPSGLQSFLRFGHIAMVEILLMLLWLREGHRLKDALTPRSTVMAALFGLWLLALLFSTLLSAHPAPAMSKNIEYLLHSLFFLFLLQAGWTAQVRTRIAIAAVLSILLYLLVMAISLAFTATPEAGDWTHYIPGFRNVRHLDYWLGAILAGLLAWQMLAGGEEVSRVKGKSSERGLTSVIASEARRSRGAIFDGSLGIPGLLRRSAPRKDGEESIWFRSPVAKGIALDLAAGTMWFFLFWSGGRGSVLSALIALALLILLLRPKAWGAMLVRQGLVATAALALSLAFPVADPSFGFLRFLSRFQHMELDAFSSGRITMWKEAFGLWLQSPWFGQGAGQAVLTMKTARGAFLHPHNVLLQWLLAWGIVGAAPAMALLAAMLGRAAGATRSAINSGQAFAFGAVLMLAVNALIDGTLYHPYPLFLFALFLALAIGPRQPE